MFHGMIQQIRRAARRRGMRAGTDQLFFMAGIVQRLQTLGADDSFTVAHYGADGKRTVHTVGAGEVFNMAAGEVEGARNG